MDVVFMTCNDNRLVLHKSPTTIATIQGRLRDGCDILEPSIMFEGAIPTYVATCNYFYIPDFQRYYYVTTMVSESSRLWSITGEVDPMYSWASGIDNCIGVVGRNENNYDVLLNDDQYIVKQNPIVTKLDFDYSFSERYYILVVAGSQSADLGPDSVDVGPSNSTTVPDASRPGWVPVPASTGNYTVNTSVPLTEGNYVMSATPSSTSSSPTVRVDVGGSNGVIATLYFDNNNTLQTQFFTVPAGETVTYYTFYSSNDISASVDYSANYDYVEVFRRS